MHRLVALLLTLNALFLIANFTSEGPAVPPFTTASAQSQLGYAVSDCVLNIARLRLLTPAAPYACVRVLGYYTPGDGGGGEFYWDDVCTTPDDGGMVIAACHSASDPFQPCPAPPPGRWKRLHDHGSVSVSWFGATGNDTTDDTECIQAAIDVFNPMSSAPTIYEQRGGTVVFPPGRYHVTGLTIPETIEGLTLKGRGRGESAQSGTWLYHTGSGTSLIRNAGVSTLKFLTIEDLSFRHFNSSGHIFELGGSLGFLHFQRLFFMLTDPLASFMKLDGVNMAHITVEDIRGFMAENAEEPAVKIVAHSPGALFTIEMANQMINSHTNATGYIYDVESRAAHLSGGVDFRDITLENPAGGGIRLASVSGSLLQNVVAADLAGPLRNPVIQFEHSDFTFVDPATDCCNLIRLSGATMIGGTLVLGNGPHSMDQTTYPDVSSVSTTVPDLTGCPPGCPPLPTPDPDGLVFIGSRLGHLDTGSKAAVLLGSTKINNVHSTGADPGREGALWLTDGISRSAQPSNNLRGRAVMDGSTSPSAVVQLPSNVSADYKVTIGALANETFWVTNKTSTQFTIHSSLPGSTSCVDWILID